MKYPSTLNCILLVIFAILFSSRGYVGVVCDIYIWMVGFYYFLHSNIQNLKLNKFYLFSHLLVFLYFILNLWVGESSDYKIFYYFSIIIPFYFIFRDFERVKFFVLSTVCFLSVISILTLADVAGFYNFDSLFYIRDGGVRASGLMVNPNYFAYMCLIFFLIFSLIFTTSIYRNVILFLLVLLIILSFSRGVTAALIVYFLFRVFSFKAIVYFLIFMIFSFIVMKLGKFDLDILYSTFEYRIENLKSGDVSGRSDVWILGFQEWFNHIKDVLFGFGFNNFQSRLRYYNVENTTHNSYLRMLYEFGILGFLILMFYYISFFVKISGVKWDVKIIFLIPISLAWLSNDFFINKDTFVFMVIFLVYASWLKKVFFLKVEN